MYLEDKTKFRNFLQESFTKSKLSKFWANFKFGNKITNLVNIQQSIKNFILVIPEVGRKTRVQFNTTACKTGCCSKIPGGFLITLDPDIYETMKKDHTPNEIVDTYSGLIFHEISHVLYTRNWENRTPLWGYIYNVLEDNRIEFLFSTAYPYLAGYLQATHNYMKTLENPKKELSNLDKIMMTFFELTRGNKITHGELTTPSGINVLDKLTSCIDSFEFSADGKYIVNMSNEVERVIMELLHDFKEELPKEITLPQMKDLYEALPEEVKKFIEEMVKKLKNVMVGAISENEKSQVEQNICIAQSQEDFKDTNVPKEKKYIYGEDANSQDKFPSKVVFSKPNNKLNVEYQEIVRDSTLVIQRLRNNFEALLFDRDIKDPNKLNGQLDKRNLFRGAFSERLFQESYTVNVQGISAAILIDESGSMGDVNTKNSKANIARQVAIILIEVVLGLKDIELEVYSFTGSSARNDMKYLYGKALPHKCSVMNYNPGSSNYDHIALWQTFKLLQEYTKNPKKIIFIISDGQPCGHNYGGTSALGLVKKQVDTIQSKGVPVIQIAIDNATTSDQMYTNWVYFKDHRSLTTDFVNLFNLVVRKMLI